MRSEGRSQSFSGSCQISEGSRRIFLYDALQQVSVCSYFGGRGARGSVFIIGLTHPRASIRISSTFSYPGLILIPGAVSSMLRLYFGGKWTLGSPDLQFASPQSFLLCSVLHHSGRYLGIPERKQIGIAFFERNPRAGNRNS